MANIKANAKSSITSKKAEARNKAHKSKFKTAFKKVLMAKQSNNSNVDKLYSEAQKIVDSGVSKGVWHKNNGNRKKSSLAKLLKTDAK